MENKSSEVPTFQFKNEGLSDRCKDVFGCLDALEQKHKAFEKTRSEEDAESDRSLIRDGPSTEDYESLTKDTFKHPGHDYHGGRRGMSRYGKERERSRPQGEFKIPNRPFRGRGNYRGRPGRGRSVPDYKVHPDKWTEYSLEDVDTSNSSMKQAAFDFLDEQRKRRENTQKEESVNIDSVACSKGLISFKKPVKTNKQEKQNEKKGLAHTSQTVAMEDDEEEEMDEREEEREEISVDSNVEMKEMLDTENPSKEKSSGKRKLESMDNGDNTEGMEEDTSDTGRTGFGFKSRKISKRNIRSRQERSGSESD